MDTLTRDERNQLYLIAWQGVHINPRWLKDDVASKLVGLGLVKRTPAGAYEANQKGLDALSSMARRALNRPRNYARLDSEQQWSIDKGLGILDWDGD